MKPFSKGSLAACTLSDASAIRRRFSGLKKIKDETKAQKIYQQLQKLQQSSSIKVANKAGRSLSIDYPAALPVSQKKQAILEAIRDNQVTIVAGETGSGKTTQLPKICLELGLGVRGFIGHTQPRRLAARSVADRIAKELNTPLGDLVGYKVRFNDQLSDKSSVKLMTDGILLAELASDKMLWQYDTIIIDEAHERSLNIDFILGYLKQLLPKRPDLKVIITSATIDVNRFSKHFNDAPVIEVSGRTFPVETRYRPLIQEDGPDLDMIDGICEAVKELYSEPMGDILVFLSGEREIRDVADALSKLKLRDTEVLPLYARLSYSEQSRIFASHTGRRIVLSTNVAETSLTVPGIRYVVDPGLARISRYSYRTKVQRLPIEPISQASANQRQGRCGRVAEGICIRLYSEDDFESRPEFTDPEILRTNLASVILQMLSIGLGAIEDFPFVQSPDNRHIRDGMLLLEELQAIELHNRLPKMTKLGRSLSRLPIDPRLARMVLQSQAHGVVKEVMIIAAGLSIQDPRERPADKQAQADQAHARFKDKSSDFLSFVNLWNYIEELREVSSNHVRKTCKSEYLAFLRIREWQDLYNQLKGAAEEVGIEVTSNSEDADSIHKSIAAGMLSHIGFKDKDNQYLGARNRKFFVFPGSSLAKKGPKWLMAAELVETSRLFGRMCGQIKPEWLEPLASHLVKRNYAEPYFDKKSAQVMAFETQTLYGLAIVNRRRVGYAQVDPKTSREIFIRQGLVEGHWRNNESFYQANRQLLTEVENLEHKSRRRDIVADEDALFAFYDERLPANIYSGANLQSWWKKHKKTEPKLLHISREELMKHDAANVTEHNYPNHFVQEGLALPLSYQFEPGHDDDGVSLMIPLGLLNQITDSGTDWLVPGLLEDKLIALIKSLPKTLRRNFVPAPNYAQYALDNMEFGEGKLLESLCKQLLRKSGVRITPDDFDISQLPAHLNMNFKVMGDKNKLLAQSRQIEPLKEQLKDKVAAAMTNLAEDDIEQQNLTEWTFGTLKSEYERKQGGFNLKAFPALAPQKDSVEIKLFDDAKLAAQSHQAGLRKLLLLNIPSPIKHLQQNLPNKAKLALYFNPFGKVQLLIDDIIDAAIDQLLAEHGKDVRDPQAFESMKDIVRSDLNDYAEKIALNVEQVLTISNQVKKKLKGKISFELAFAMSDIGGHHDALVYPGFVSKTGAERLPDLIRYMNAMIKRLEKLAVDPNRDRLHMLKIQAVEKDYQALKNKLGNKAEQDLNEIVWMLEELKVSSFAQTLGTKYPISDKRIKQAMNDIKAKY
ncbi:ATP-dependent RNA helicase HrpA [Paraferrimonas sp. SM1919]|uniref:ATP-dependent RNA helicase HrpA n=1 Tax=Paraferrimonas sp. SM1919 TaxID=2662263 RepID=UPI0013D0EEC5|nr:ATP-dependent RNA helicase HrpA [Paraferrimonas sp. SM1919]